MLLFISSVRDCLVYSKFSKRLDGSSDISEGRSNIVTTVLSVLMYHVRMSDHCTSIGEMMVRIVLCCNGGTDNI